MEDDQLAELARAADLDALYAHSAAHPQSAYTWLLYALDLGHDDAEDVIADVEEHRDAFRHDDGFVVACAHRDLARAYLHAQHGVPHDFERAGEHLDVFLLYTFGSLENDDEVRAQTIAELAVGLNESVAAKLRAFAGKLPFRLVKHRVDRIERLHELRAPAVIVQNEVKQLRASVDAVERLIG